MKNLRLHSSGVFSNVYRGTLLSPGARKEIAVKKTWPDAEMDAHANLELEILLAVSSERHKNIIQVLYTFRTLTPDKKRHICHRDIKPQNLLIEPISGILKIADFGSAKIIRKTTKSTSYQVTRFYRPPELLLEATFYSPQVDVWSAGCVLGEITKGGILFAGRDAKHQLKLVVDALGSPDDDELLDMKANTRFAGGRVAPRGFEFFLPNASPEIIDILQRILVYSPKKRLCGKALLSDPFFHELFIPDKRRTNGSFVSACITTDDLHKVPTRPNDAYLAKKTPVLVFDKLLQAYVA
ncbi:unnamed protein product [Gongylonema pulchrum]|uniref:Protein kinase domain-containing protein n=1 Tax=Gongylonema pulchrum TaxID=637853 RepID=A0A183E240_9BILA|nr:unnamed protein product [Gongylonema pulchrum]